MILEGRTQAGDPAWSVWKSETHGGFRAMGEDAFSKEFSDENNK